MKNLILFFLVCIPLYLVAQQEHSQPEEGKKAYKEYVSETFESTRLINAQTVETLKAGELNVLISHRFDDIAGDRGGYDGFYGIDNVTDVRLALEYGLRDNLMIGLGRSKGFAPGPTKLIDGFIKWKLINQGKEKGSPISVAFYANTVYSTQERSPNPVSIANFEKAAYRLSYDFQIMIARKFSDRFSLQIMPNFLHRNYVVAGDENNNFSIGAAARIRLTKNIGLILDYYHLFSEFRTNEESEEALTQFYNPLGIGFEINTGGHVFVLNFSNSPGIVENNFIPYTTRNWLDGEFRFGFTVSRFFQL